MDQSTREQQQREWARQHQLLPGEEAYRSTRSNDQVGNLEFMPGHKKRKRLYIQIEICAVQEVELKKDYPEHLVTSRSYKIELEQFTEKARCGIIIKDSINYKEDVISKTKTA